MIQVFRVLSLLVGVYMIYLLLSGFSAGMVPVWFCFFVGLVTLSIKPSYEFLMGFICFKVLMVTGFVVLSVLLLLIFYVGNKNTLETQADVIIVLGAKVNPKGMSLTLQKRVDKAYDYLMEHPKTLAVLSGGQGVDEPVSEALAMYEYLLERGIKKERLLIEDQSTSTAENIVFSYNRLKEEDIYQTIEDLDVLIISSHFHIYRAIMIAKQSGYIVSGLGCSTLQSLEANYYLREVFAVIYQFSKNFL